MKPNDFIGLTVTFYLESGHKLSGKVKEISAIEDLVGKAGYLGVFVLADQTRTVLVPFDKIVAYEIKNG